MVTNPPGDTSLMRWFALSPTTTFPLESKATPNGPQKEALVATPLACAALPLPASVLTIIPPSQAVPTIGKPPVGFALGDGLAESVMERLLVGDTLGVAEMLRLEEGLAKVAIPDTVPVPDEEAVPLPVPDEEAVPLPAPVAELEPLLVADVVPEPHGEAVALPLPDALPLSVAVSEGLPVPDAQPLAVAVPDRVGKAVPLPLPDAVPEALPVPDAESLTLAVYDTDAV